jgi:hypothetical protein
VVGGLPPGFWWDAEAEAAQQLTALALEVTAADQQFAAVTERDAKGL